MPIAKIHGRGLQYSNQVAGRYRSICCYFLFPVFFLLQFHSAIASSGFREPAIPARFNQVRVADFIRLSPRQLSTAGVRLNFGEKVSLQLMKVHMRKQLKSNPDLTISEYLASRKKMKTWLLVLLIVVGVVLLTFLIFALAYSGKIF